MYFCSLFINVGCSVKLITQSLQHSSEPFVFGRYLYHSSSNPEAAFQSAKILRRIANYPNIQIRLVGDFTHDQVRPSLSSLETRVILWQQQLPRYKLVCLSYILVNSICVRKRLEHYWNFQDDLNRFHETLGCFYCVHVSVSCVKADVNLNVSTSGCKWQAHGRLCGVSGQWRRRGGHRERWWDDLHLSIIKPVTLRLTHLYLKY